MKKLVVMIICILTWAVVASAANSVPGSVGAPQNFSVSLIDAEQVCFSWTPVIDPVPAVKYSLELTVDGIHEFDFESRDYDVNIATDPVIMCIPRLDIAEDITGDGIPDLLIGHATARVKGLNPGKGMGRQNNLFSAILEFDLP